jgi:hypothetical protein
MHQAKKPVPRSGRTAQAATMVVVAASALMTVAPDAHAKALDDPADAHGNLLGVVAITPDDAWAVGTIPGHPWHNIAKHWDGTTWTAAKTPPPRSKYACFNWAGRSGSNDAWAVGLYRLGAHRYCLVEHWDGHTWRRVAT